MSMLIHKKSSAPRNSWKHVHDEYRYLRLLRILSLGAGSIFFALLVWVIFFSYEHIYLSIGKVHNILILKASTSIEVINFTAYEKTRDMWKQRTEVEILPDITRSPFDDVIPNTPTSTPKSTL